jgi:hypothetical protein
MTHEMEIDAEIDLNHSISQSPNFIGFLKIQWLSSVATTDMESASSDVILDNSNSDLDNRIVRFICPPLFRVLHIELAVM